MNKSYEIDMCNGPIFGKVLKFALPLMLSGVLQLLFNAADIIVVGRFAGSQSLAAVGSTSALINLLINIFIGLSVGANVVVAKAYGARNQRDISRAVHTALTLSIISGLILIVVGVASARVLLELMGTPDDVLDKAVLYMRIYFAGMPVVMVYNFGSAILRAVGDTRRPLYFLLLAGMVNVVLNLFFVIVLHMDVAGVALATVISQCISAGLILWSLKKSRGGMKLYFRLLRIHKNEMIQIFRIGLPAGMQGAVFSISNVLIQSSVNSFGSIAMAGNTAASNIEGFVYTAMNALYQTNLSFTSQNVGGGKYSRINKILLICVGTVTVVGLVLGLGAYAGGSILLHIYSSDPEVIQYGLLRMSIICTTYFLCGIMDTLVGSLRGLGYSVMPMIVSLTGACAFRVLWIFTVFAIDRSLTVLYISYPVSWLITAAAHGICFYMIRKKYPREDVAV
ncbi:MAG TPA: MATE family efflux transporter [Candidatus Hungatella pullicola]|nr:MATE family efflux transporter [Candidatus Hungatella pullicola]